MYLFCYKHTNISARIPHPPYCMKGSILHTGGSTMATVKALSPDEVLAARKEATPNDVFEVFNELITQNFNGSHVYVGQDDVIARLEKRGHSRSEIFANH